MHLISLFIIISHNLNQKRIKPRVFGSKYNKLRNKIVCKHLETQCAYF